MSEFTYKDLERAFQKANKIKEVLKYPVIQRVIDDIGQFGNIDSFQNVVGYIALMELKDESSAKLIKVLQKASEDWKKTAQVWEKAALAYKKLLDLK